MKESFISDPGKTRKSLIRMGLVNRELESNCYNHQHNRVGHGSVHEDGRLLQLSSGQTLQLSCRETLNVLNN